jgi:hypothetical protein
MFVTDFEIPAGDEFYQCQRLTLPEDLHIVRIAPESPTGVHHQVLAIDPSPGAEGKSIRSTDCPATDTNWKVIYASGVGTGPLSMPPEVMYQAQRGQQVLLGLHLFNATQQTLKAEVGVKLTLVDDATGYTPAGFPYVGRLPFTIGPNRTITGSCTVDKDTSIFAVFPHMHQTGEHLKITAGATVVWDRPFSFTEQKFGAFPDWDTTQPEVKLEKGEKISVECKYTADGVGKSFGDSSDQEMCFGFAFLYPAISTTAGTPFCYF